MAEHNVLGKKGEELALAFLKEKGYAILDVNWTYYKDELDIICTFRNQLVVVEVKTLKSDEFGEPELKVTLKKQANIIRAANAYLEKKEIDAEVRFDVVSVLMDTPPKINHIEDAFYPQVG